MGYGEKSFGEKRGVQIGKNVTFCGEKTGANIIIRLA